MNILYKTLWKFIGTVICNDTLLLSWFQLCATCNNNTFVLGKAEETKIIIESDESKPPVFMFHHENYTTTIALSCCSSCETHLYVESLNKTPNEYVSSKFFKRNRQVFLLILLNSCVFVSASTLNVYLCL